MRFEQEETERTENETRLGCFFQQTFSPLPLLTSVQLLLNASRTAAINFSSLNGFMKNATGPIAIAVARAAKSSRAVITITFVFGEIAQSRASTSKPVTPSIQMSVTTTGTRFLLACARNSSALLNGRTLSPSDARR